MKLIKYITVITTIDYLLQVITKVGCENNINNGDNDNKRKTAMRSEWVCVHG